MPIDVHHYPIDAPFKDGVWKLWKCYGGVSGYSSPNSANATNYGPAMRGVGCRSSGGSSGGGWFYPWDELKGGRLVSNVVRVGPNSERSHGPFLGNRARREWIYARQIRFQ